MITGSSSCKLCRLHIWPTAQRIFMEHMRRYCENQFATMYRNSVAAIWCAFRKLSTLRVVLSFSICPPGETCDNCPPGGKVQTFLKFWTRRNARQKNGLRPAGFTEKLGRTNSTPVMCSSLRRCSAQQPRRSRSFSKSGSPRKSRWFWCWRWIDVNNWCKWMQRAEPD